MPTVKYSFFAIDAFLKALRRENLGMPGGLRFNYEKTNDCVNIKDSQTNNKRVGALLVKIPRIKEMCKN